MAVAIKDTATSPNSTFGTAATTLSNTNLTVTSGATVLVGVLATSTTITSVSMTWNSVAMTLVSTGTNGTNVVRIFGLLAPATGHNTLTASWTTTSQAEISAVTFQGTATDTIANAFKLANSSTGSTTAMSLTASSVVGNICLAGGVNSGSSATNLVATGSTSFFNESGSCTGLGAYASGAASVVWSSTTAATPWAIASIDVSAPAAATFKPYNLWPQLAPILAQ